MITERTRLSELQRLRLREAGSLEALLRSVRQSVQAEGYTVSLDQVRESYRRTLNKETT